ncbi:MAG TPA: F0F1 ATP synthase subunit delta [Methylibium sp.]|uniref:F0F1 ATP synthase subunit delta n=1 Tax=Methylibium sp. TaxID=2067992 RepID=UPI002DBCECCB|nr:F0F1 ATP synthase subunit delta [Methylibium sp.]HEU4460386.1 F0F1 ATP synthase subunit delta [Methylibium sp.]
MAELATIARPYAEALFKAGGDAAVAEQLSALAAVAADARLLQFAANPKVDAQQVQELIVGVAKIAPAPSVRNLLAAVIDNGRLAALPEIAAQFHALVNAKSGVSDALVYSAFPIDAAQLAEVKAALEKRFGRKLDAKLSVAPELIGGIRVVVGDEVLDTSVKARLDAMKQALVA